MKIQLLLTGNELMTGHTVDSNSAMIATTLGLWGYAVDRKVTIGDDRRDLLAEMAAMSQASDLLIINGGLGPTSDDLTAEILGELLHQPICEHPEAIAHLQSWCQRIGLALNDANRKQAMLPAGVDIVANPIGSAVGFSTVYNNCLIICTPGVPRELKAMLDDSIVQILLNRFPVKQRKSTLRLQTFGIGESTVQQWINNEFSDWPDAVELGFRAGAPLLELKLSIANEADEATRKRCLNRMMDLIGDYVVGEDDASLADAVIHKLAAMNATVATAESCTGGRIASEITAIPGASQVFQAGWVCYSNSAKMSQLGVNSSTLEHHGAVSEQVVREMAIGAIERAGSDHAIAVSGIAGPDGGTAEKPVGTVAIAWGTKHALHSCTLLYPAQRKQFQAFITAICLDLLRRQLSSIDTPPRYFENRLIKRQS